MKNSARLSGDSALMLLGLFAVLVVLLYEPVKGYIVNSFSRRWKSSGSPTGKVEEQRKTETSVQIKKNNEQARKIFEIGFMVSDRKRKIIEKKIEDSSSKPCREFYSSEKPGQPELPALFETEEKKNAGVETERDEGEKKNVKWKGKDCSSGTYPGRTGDGYPAGISSREKSDNEVRNGLGEGLKEAGNAFKLYENGRTSEALILFEEAIENTQDRNLKMSLHVGAARCLMNPGSLDRARKHLEEALRIDNKNGEALNEMGRLYLLSGENTKAAFYFTQALRYGFQVDREILTSLLAH